MFTDGIDCSMKVLLDLVLFMCMVCFGGGFSIATKWARNHHTSQSLQFSSNSKGDVGYFFPWDNEEGLESGYNFEEDFGVYRKKKAALPLAFRERIASNDLLQVNEIERMFTPSKIDRDHIIGSTLSKGFAGFIIGLESVLVDATNLFEECFLEFLHECRYQPDDNHKSAGKKGFIKLENHFLPSTISIHDTIGLPFRDACMELQIGIPKHRLVEAEQIFYSVMNRILDDWMGRMKQPIRAQKGGIELINSILNDRNELVVQSNLPRDMAQRLLSLSGIAAVLEGNVHIDHFMPYPFPYQLSEKLLENNLSDGIDQNILCRGQISDDEDGILNHSSRPHHPDDESDEDYDEMIQNFYAPIHGDRYQTNQYLRGCAIMQSIPSMTLVVEGNRKNIFTAKRLGMSCIAVKGLREYVYIDSCKYSFSGNSLNAQLLRGADIVIDDLTHLNMHHSYQVL